MSAQQQQQQQQQQEQQEPASSAAAMHQPEPPYQPVIEDDEPEGGLRIVIFGQPLLRVVVVGALAAVFLFGVVRFVRYSQAETQRSAKEVAPLFQR